MTEHERSVNDQAIQAYKLQGSGGKGMMDSIGSSYGQIQ